MTGSAIAEDDNMTVDDNYVVVHSSTLPHVCLCAVMRILLPGCTFETRSRETAGASDVGFTLASFSSFLSTATVHQLQYYIQLEWACPFSSG